MIGNWTFGWDAIAAIFGILAFLGFVVVEWEKIVESELIGKFLGTVIFVGYGVIVGYTISQSMILRLVSLVLSY